jgi:nicotinamide-nucleotide amidase
VGSELLLGQLDDTNATAISQQLALAGIDCHFRTTVGDNEGRIAAAVQGALGRSDAVIACGGLGPTPDDVTREGIARALGVRLVRDQAMVGRIRELFESRRRPMAASNARQADLPEGARFIPQATGTAPGLVCPAGSRVVYALPGVPHEMQEMLEREVIPDLRRRRGSDAVILSRVLRVWGLAESTLAERVAPRFEALEEAGNPTIAFLAGGAEGIKVRITAKAVDEDEAGGMLDAEEKELRRLLGDYIFSVDETMEQVVGRLLQERGLTVGVAESLTGGLVGSRLAETPGASKWFRGSVVAYDSKVKYDLLGVPEGPVVSAEAASAMAEGVAKLLGADVGLATTGVAGPEPQDGRPVGTVFVAVDGPLTARSGSAGGGKVEALRLNGGRAEIRMESVRSVLAVLLEQLAGEQTGNERAQDTERNGGF